MGANYSYSTSLPAYKKALETVTESQATVLETMKALCRLHHDKRCYEEQVTRKLGWDRNRVTPRVNELLKNGLIERLEKKEDNGRGNKVYWYRIVQPKAETGTQQNLFNAA